MNILINKPIIHNNMYRRSSSLISIPKGKIYYVLSPEAIMLHNILPEAVVRAMYFHNIPPKNLSISSLFNRNVPIHQHIQNISKHLNFDDQQQQTLKNQINKTVNVLSQDPDYTELHPGFLKIIPNLKYHGVSNFILSNPFAETKTLKNIYSSFVSQGFVCDLITDNDEFEIDTIVEKFSVTQNDIIMKVCNAPEDIKKLHGKKITTIGYTESPENKRILYENGAHYVVGNYYLLPNILITEKNNLYKQ